MTKEVWSFDEDTGNITINGKPFLSPDPDCEFESFVEFKVRALKATATPDLLEALKKLLSLVQRGPQLDRGYYEDWKDAIKLANLSIAKAEAT